jgi:hypothetical protein
MNIKRDRKILEKHLGYFSTAQEAHEAYIKELNRRSKDA